MPRGVRFDRDCPEGGACVDAGDRRVCWYPDEPGAGGGPCPEGLAQTADGRCGEPCREEEPRCDYGRICSGEACVEDPAAADGDGDADADAGDGGADADALPPLGACLDLGIPGSTPIDEIACSGRFAEMREVGLVAAFMMETYLAPPVVVADTLDLDTTVCAAPAAGMDGCRVVAGDARFCVLALSRLVIAGGASLRVAGDIPLVLLSVEEIQVQGTITAAAEGARPGPGGGTSESDTDETCLAASSATTAGGGGGGLGTAGGDGGCAPGSGGSACATCADRRLRGGTGGGASRTEASGAVPGGGGGGGLYLMSRTRIVVGASGRVSADGGLGGGPHPSLAGGGGGGGSGGTIVLDAPSVGVDGEVGATGGSGGTSATAGFSYVGGAGAGSTAGLPGSGGECVLEGGPFGSGGGGGAGRVFVRTSTGGRSGSGSVAPDVTACTTLAFTCGD